MNSNTTDFDTIRARWQQMGNATTAKRPDPQLMIERLRGDRSRSLTQRLAFRYLLLAIIGIVVLPANAISLHMSVGVSLSASLAVAIFGFMAGAGSLYFYFLLRNSDYVSLPTVEALRRIVRFDTLRSNVRLTTILLMIPVLIWLLYSFYAIDPVIFWGGAAGAVIGAAIGIAVDLRMRRDIAALKRIFSEETEP